MDKVYFAKVKENGIIPSKRNEDGAYDIYACFDNDELYIHPNDIVFIKTGIASSFSSDYRLILKERGSTGSIGLSVRCGVIDSGFLNEWSVILNNTSDNLIIITKNIEEKKSNNGVIYYPYSKAIAQASLQVVPKVEIVEIPYSELITRESEKGLGMLGSSGK